MKALARSIEAILDAWPADNSVSAELLAVIRELGTEPHRLKKPTREQVLKVADLYTSRYGRDFQTTIEMAVQIEQSVASKKFSRSVRIELERRRSHFEKTSCLK